jgi:hypothetical protein
MTDHPKALVERRTEPRLPPRARVWPLCRARVLGPDLAAGLLDVSRGGLRLALSRYVPAGREVSVVLKGPPGGGGFHRRGVVIWSALLEGGACVAGVRLERPLSDEELRRFGRG